MYQLRTKKQHVAWGTYPKHVIVNIMISKHVYCLSVSLICTWDIVLINPIIVFLKDGTLSA